MPSTPRQQLPVLRMGDGREAPHASAQVQRDRMRPFDCAFVNDGAHLAVVASSRHVALWDASFTTPRKLLRGPERPVTSLAAWPNVSSSSTNGSSSSSSILAAGTDDGAVFVWDAASGALLCAAEMHAGSRRVLRIAVSPTGRFVVSLCDDEISCLDLRTRSVSTWDALQRRGVDAALELNAAEGPPGHSSSLAKPPTCLLALQRVTLISGAATHVVAAAGSELLLMCECEEAVAPGRSSSYSAETPVLRVAHAMPLPGLRAPATAIAARPLAAGGISAGVNEDEDDHVAPFLAVGAADGSVMVYSARLSLLLRAGPGKGGHQDRVTDIDCSPDGSHFATCSIDCTVRLWRWAALGDAPVVIAKHSNRVASVRFNPVYAVFASASFDLTVKLWRLNGTMVSSARGHTEYIRAVAFHPAGHLIATCAEDATCRLTPMPQRVDAALWSDIDGAGRPRRPQTPVVFRRSLSPRGAVTLQRVAPERPSPPPAATSPPPAARSSGSRPPVSPRGHSHARRSVSSDAGRQPMMSISTPPRGGAHVITSPARRNTVTARHSPRMASTAVIRSAPPPELKRVPHRGARYSSPTTAGELLRRPRRDEVPVELIRRVVVGGAALAETEAQHPPSTSPRPNDPWESANEPRGGSVSPDHLLAATLHPEMRAPQRAQFAVCNPAAAQRPLAPPLQPPSSDHDGGYESVSSRSVSPNPTLYQQQPQRDRRLLCQDSNREVHQQSEPLSATAAAAVEGGQPRMAPVSAPVLSLRRRSPQGTAASRGHSSGGTATSADVGAAERHLLRALVMAAPRHHRVAEGIVFHVTSPIRNTGAKFRQRFLEFRAPLSLAQILDALPDAATAVGGIGDRGSGGNGAAPVQLGEDLLWNSVSCEAVRTFVAAQLPPTSLLLASLPSPLVPATRELCRALFAASTPLEDADLVVASHTLLLHEATESLPEFVGMCFRWSHEVVRAPAVGTEVAFPAVSFCTTSARSAALALGSREGQWCGTLVVIEANRGRRAGNQHVFLGDDQDIVYSPFARFRVGERSHAVQCLARLLGHEAARAADAASGSTLASAATLSVWMLHDLPPE